MTLPNPALSWPIPMHAVAMIAEREGCRLRAYRCPAGRWTCGWGETEGVGPDTEWTQEQADHRLYATLATRAAQVRLAAREAPTPNQLGALVSLQYNIGQTAFERSSVLKAHNRGDWQAAARAFSLWDKARVNGTLTVLPGLTARRAAEAALYLTPEPDAPREPMPQAVEAEAPLAASPILQGGAATAGTGLLAAVAEAKDAAGPVGEAFTAGRELLANAIGVPPSWVLPLVLVIAGIVVVRWRLKQRRDGWA